MLARDVMTTEVETAAPDDEVSDVLTRLARADFDGFPVVDEDDVVVGIVTVTDLIHLFQPSDRVFWVPIGLPPFTETVTYPIDLSWDDFDLGVDLLKNAGRSVSEVMTTDVVTVRPDDDLDRVLDLLADEERDINRVPVVEAREARSASDGASGEQSDPRADGTLAGIIARQDLLRAIRDERRR